MLDRLSASSAERQEVVVKRVGQAIFQILEYGIVIELKSQDLLVLLKKAANPGKSWTYTSLGEALGLSASQVHRSVHRATEAGLAISKGRGDWEVIAEALLEFAVHGIRYAFPGKIGAVRRGVPTSFGAPPLAALISAAPGEAPVWPHAEGKAKGPSLSPLYKQVPDAALAQKLLSERMRQPRAA